MNRVQTLHRSPSLIVERFDHPEHMAHTDEGPEITQSIVVTFVQHGDFELLENRKRWTFNQFDVLVSRPGIPRRYLHRHECPTDVCLSLCFSPELVEEALGHVPDSQLPPRVAAGATTRFGLRRVLGALDARDSAAIESVAFDCAVALGPHHWSGPAELSGVSAHAGRIERACEAMKARLAEDQSLTSIARDIGMSPFYFARVFRQLAGQSPHQYLVRARLGHAARLLRQGASVTEAALSSGFGNLSHFTNTFHRRFGVAPADYRRRSSRRLHHADLG